MAIAESARRHNPSAKVYPPGLSQDQLRTWQTMDFGSELVRFEDKEGYLRTFSDQVKAGALGILAGNHDHHFNIANVIRMMEAMPEKPRKTEFVVATTLLEGDQGKPLQKFTLDAQPALAEHNIEYISVYRGEQDDKYIKTEERRAEIMETNRANMRGLFREIRSGEELAIAAFLPGGISAARKKPLRQHPWPWGRRPGTLKVPNDLLPTIVRYCQKIGRDVSVLPFTNDRTYRLVEPDTQNPTLYAKGVYIAQRLGIDVYASRLVVHVPLGTKDIERIVGDLKKDDAVNEAVNEAVMKIIVGPLPRHDKGYYRNR